MAVATINRFIALFADAFEALSAEVPIVEVERLAMLIHHSMDQGRRVYHTSTHVFDLGQGMNPRQVLATLFHDLVYYQLDGGFPRLADTLLKPVVRIENGSLVLTPIEEGDAGLAMCAGVFGFRAGQTLALYGGLNEYLSAVVATRLLQRYLRVADLIAIVACIEATIPFRGPDAHGRGTADLLADRVREASRASGSQPAESEIERVVTEAVTFANRDVGSFSEEDPATFLATTWLLIEESNAPLKAVGVYSIQEYRDALSRMEQCLCALNPDHIFHRYHDTPSEAEFAALCAAARRNLVFSGDYLGAKIVAIAIVEALAQVTGGDCPVSMFLGDIRSPYGRPDRVEDFLPPPSRTARVDPQLMAVLEKGRAKESTSDLNTSPLTAFIYRWLGPDEMRHALQRAKQMFAGELSGADFLTGLDRAMIRVVTQACGKVALSRKRALSALEKTL